MILLHLARSLRQVYKEKALRQSPTMVGMHQVCSKHQVVQTMLIALVQRTQPFLYPIHHPVRKPPRQSHLERVQASEVEVA